jgi:hypothetical protein
MEGGKAFTAKIRIAARTDSGIYGPYVKGDGRETEQIGMPEVMIKARWNSEHGRLGMNAQGQY